MINLKTGEFSFEGHSIKPNMTLEDFRKSTLYCKKELLHYDKVKNKDRMHYVLKERFFGDISIVIILCFNSFKILDSILFEPFNSHNLPAWNEKSTVENVYEYENKLYSDTMIFFEKQVKSNVDYSKHMNYMLKWGEIHSTLERSDGRSIMPEINITMEYYSEDFIKQLEKNAKMTEEERDLRMKKIGKELGFFQ